jgi:hypothetical protein
VNLKSTHIVLIPSESGMMFGRGPRVVINEDGTFEISDVNPNTYTVNVTSPAGTYVKSVLLGSVDIKDKDLDFTGGGNGELNIVLRYGTAEVNGNLQPPAAAEVILIPEGADSWNVRRVTADTSGAFSLKDLPPGKYNAYALEDIDYSQLQNPAAVKALEAKATPVELKENDHKPLTLSVVPAADVQDLLARAGVETQ